jgi:hypothetical protein
VSYRRQIGHQSMPVFLQTQRFRCPMVCSFAPKWNSVACTETPPALSTSIASLIEFAETASREIASSMTFIFKDALLSFYASALLTHPLVSAGSITASISRLAAMLIAPPRSYCSASRRLNSASRAAASGAASSSRR